MTLIRPSETVIDFGTLKNTGSGRRRTLWLLSEAPQVLGVEATADRTEIARAFRQLALAHHPDRNPDGPASSSAFRTILAAYEDTQKTHRIDVSPSFGSWWSVRRVLARQDAWIVGGVEFETLERPDAEEVVETIVVYVDEDEFEISLCCDTSIGPLAMLGKSRLVRSAREHAEGIEAVVLVGLCLILAPLLAAAAGFVVWLFAGPLAAGWAMAFVFMGLLVLVLLAYRAERRRPPRSQAGRGRLR